MYVHCLTYILSFHNKINCQLLRTVLDDGLNGPKHGPCFLSSKPYILKAETKLNKGNIKDVSE